MVFRASFCDPFNPTIIELGDIAESQIVHIFDKVPWVDYLTQMQTRGENEIHFSLSLEIENKATRCGLTVSAVGNPEKYEFYVFYKRPKKAARFFGLTSRMNNNYLTDAEGLTE